MKFDKDQDGLIENGGYADQTYDGWVATGPRLGDRDFQVWGGELTMEGWWHSCPGEAGAASLTPVPVPDQCLLWRAVAGCCGCDGSDGCSVWGPGCPG